MFEQCHVCGKTDTTSFGKCVHCGTPFTSLEDGGKKQLRNEWSDFVAAYEAAAEYSRSLQRYWGGEEAGFAYGHIAQLEDKVALLCGLLWKNGIPIPEELAAESLPQSPND